jgi:hypothetical protein
MKNNLLKLFEKTDRHIPPAIRKKIQAHRRRLAKQFCPGGASAIQAVFLDQVVKLTAFADLCAGHETLKRERRRFERAAKSALKNLKELKGDEDSARPRS